MGADFPVIEGVRFASIPGFPGYAASDDGHIWSCKNRGWRKLKPAISSQTQYYAVTLRANGRSFRNYIHRLVLTTFVRPPEAKEEGCHGNRNRFDNRLENLRWGTRKDNAQDAIRHGTATIGEKNGQAKLTAQQASEIRRRCAAGERPRRIAVEFNISRGQAERIVNRTCWNSVP